ncbi:MAG: hypothetical protein ACRCXY_00835 [Fusobacteriaceae bacterium]
MDNFFKSKKGIITVYIIGIIILIFLSEYKGLNPTILFTLFSVTIPFFEKAMSEEYKTKLNKNLEDYKNGINEKMENQKKELNKELEEYKTKLSGYTLVTKLQFELEFKIYTEIYEGLSEVQKEVIQLAPIIDCSSNDSTYTERYSKFAKLINDIILKKIKYRPFYSKEIYNGVEKIIILCSKEGTNFKIANLEKLERFDFRESIKIKKEIEKELEILSDLIKDRIQNMKIID